MAIIHILDRQSDNIIDDITEKYILDNTHERSLKSTLESFEFVTFGDKRFSQYLEKRNKIIIPKEDAGYQEFIISESVKIHEDEFIEIEVFTDASYLELKKASVIEPQTFTEYTPSMGVSRALRDTPWQAGIIEGSGYRTFTFDKHTNPYDFIKKIAKEFDLELNFRVEIDGYRIIGRYVDLVERIGEWHGVEVEFGKNLKGIRRTENTDDVVTALKGLGPERDDGSRLEVIIKDNDALDRWGIKDKNGEVQHLIETYEPESSDQDMSIEDLTKYTKAELDKRIKEVVEYEGNIYDLEHVPGLENIKIRFGDTIRIKDTKFNPSLYLEARIHTQKRNIVKKARKQVTLGDYVEFTEEEVTSIWRELQDEIQKKIDLKDLLDRTYDKETIDSKDEIILGDGKEYSRNVSNEAEERANKHADDVSSEAERLAKEYAEGEINQSESRILEATVAKAIFDSTIDDIMGDLAGKAENSVVKDLQEEVADKADAVWVEGQLHLKQGSIPQQATEPTDPTENMLWLDTSEKPNVMKRFDGLEWVKATPTEAGEIGSYTIKEVDDALDNRVSVTEYTTDMDGVISDLSSHESRITQTETDITSKVERTTFEALEDDVGTLGTKMSSAETAIEQNADDIALKASQSSVNTLTGEVEDLDAELTIQAGKIASKVEQDEFDSETNTLGNKISEVEQTADGIKQEVSDVQADLDDVGIWKKDYKVNTENPLVLTESDGSSLDDEYTYEVTAKVSGTGTDTTAVAIFKSEVKGTQSGEGWELIKVYERGTSSNHPEFFIDDNGNPSIRLYNHTSTYTVRVTHEKKYGRETSSSEASSTLSSHKTLIDQNADEIALRATKSEVNTLTGRMDSAETEISVNADEINSRATKTSVDNLTGRVSTAESDITQNATEIEARVEKDGVIAAINLTSETAKIQAENIELVGAVTVLSDIAGNLGNITAGKIKGVDIEGSTILQEGSDGSILLDNTGLHKLDADGKKRVSISNENWEFQGFSPASIALNPEDMEFVIVEGGHGLGDAFIGYPDGGRTNSQFNIWNEAGTINLNSTEVAIGDFRHTLKDNNGDFRIQSTGGYTAFASQYDKVHLQSPSGVHINQWLSGANYTDLYTGVIRSQTQYVLDTSSYSGTTYMHIKKNTMMGVYEDDGTYIIDFRGNIGSANNKSIRLMNLENYTASSSANMYISGAMNVIRSTSARKYKKDIEIIEDWRAERFFEEAKPVWFRGNGEGDLENYSYYGYVADDIAKFEPRLVEFSKDNEPDGLAYDRIPAMLHVVMKKDRKRLDELARVSDDNSDDIDLLKMEIRMLRKRVEKLEQEGA